MLSNEICAHIFGQTIYVFASDNDLTEWYLKFYIFERVKS